VSCANGEAARPTGVVHEDVDTSVALDREVDQRLRLVLAPSVCAEEDGTVAGVHLLQRAPLLEVLAEMTTDTSAGAARDGAPMLRLPAVTSAAPIELVFLLHDRPPVRLNVATS
jgi:hypothetical protein